jgi:surface polysaccharide O-acyltransferase-like enzyme
VIIIHVTAGFTYLGGVPLLFLTVINIGIDVVAHYAVPLFVFISGYTLCRQYDPARPLADFYRRRFSRIGHPYLIFSLLYYGLSMLEPGYRFEGQATFLAFATANTAYHLWYFMLIAQLYLIFPVLMGWFRKVSARGQMIMLGVAAGVQILWELVYPSAATSLALHAPSLLTWLLNGTVFNMRCALTHVGYLVLGMWMADRAPANLRPPVWRGLLLAVCLLATLVARIWVMQLVQHGGWQAIPMGGLTAATVTGVFLYMGLLRLLYQHARHSAPGWGNTALEWLGERSFGIYLVHVAILSGANALMFRLGIGADQPVFYLLGLGTTLGGSVLLVELINRIPWLRPVIGG